MPSKRKSSALGLERRVRTRREDDWEPAMGSDGGESSPDGLSEEGTDGVDDDSDSAASEDGSESGSESDDADADEDAAKDNLSSVSFGALARAQASLPPSSRRSKKAAADDAATTDMPHDATGRSTTKKTEPKPKPKRSSKHAPQEQTSKKPVSRRREILADPRRKHRDPRFDPLVGSGHLDESKAGKAYAFLDDYRDSEMAELRAQIKKTRDAEAKERLKRQLMSMESRKKATRKRHDEEALLREHRRQEKELVAQGKKPFYLKRSEQKERLLTKRYEGMSKGQVDKAIARKRKKVAGKEKKELDSLQRVRDRH